MVMNIVYSTVVACLVEVFLIANVSMISSYLRETRYRDSFFLRLTETETLMAFVYLLSGIAIFSVTFFALQERSMRYISRISSAIQNISEGDLNTTIEVRGDDEFTAMAVNLNKMVGDIRNLMDKEREAERTKNELITNVAHDLRTPLTSIIGYLELLSGKVEIPAEMQKKYIDIAYAKSKRLEKLIEDLFGFTKMNYGKVAVNSNYPRSSTVPTNTVQSSTTPPSESPDANARICSASSCGLPPERFDTNSMNVSSLCSPGIASRIPSLIIMIFSPSHIFRDIRTGSAFCMIPIGSPPASRNSTPSRPRIKVGTAPSFIASSTPVPRSIQHRSIVAGFCSVPACRSTVFTNLSADRAENPVSSRRWVSSMTFSLSSLALLPLPMPSDRLIITCPGSPVCTVHVSPEIGSPSLGRCRLWAIHGDIQCQLPSGIYLLPQNGRSPHCG